MSSWDITVKETPKTAEYQGYMWYAIGPRAEFLSNETAWADNEAAVQDAMAAIDTYRVMKTERESAGVWKYNYE